MAAPGRNDPCSCGSGRKYKHCCGSMPARPAAITDDDRQLAYDVLARLAATPRFTRAAEAAAALVMAEAESMAGPLDDPEDELAAVRFFEWFAFDFVVDDGQTLAECALASRRADLTPGARRCLEQLQATPLAIMRVDTVDSDGGVSCSDLLEARRPWRILNPGIELERHDLLVARPIEHPGGVALEGVPSVLLIDKRRTLQRDLQRLRRTAQREGLPPRLLRTLMGAALLRLIAAYEASLDEGLYTAEGDPASPVDVQFSVRDVAAVRSALDAAPDFVSDDEGSDDDGRLYSWHQPADDRTGTYIFGLAELHPDRLSIGTMSQARAERARDRVLAIAGDTVSFVGFSEPDLDEDLNRR